MATNLALDDRLIDEARAVGGHKTEKEAVTAALRCERLRERLDAFDDVVAETVDHERAAAFFTACRAKGISPGAIDVLICAVAARHGLAIFTTDADFSRHAEILPLRLHQPAQGRHG